ncbi:MAG TPA: hypothetical protein VGB42_11485 [Candidatus Thermoplasmatota archaeon]
MALRLVDSQSDAYRAQLERARSFVGEWLACTDLGGNEVVRTAVAGSHAKGLDNARSDVDLMVYYRYAVPNILRMRRSTLSTRPAGTIQRVEREAVTYAFEGGHYETILTPLRSLGSDKDLWQAVAQPNVDIVFKFLRSYPLSSSGAADELERFLLDEFHMPPGAVYGYFDGYATSQFMRLQKAVQKAGSGRGPEVNDSVKMLIEGAGMMLAGAMLLERGEMSFSFEATLRRYESGLRDPAFVWSLFEHKTDRHRLEGEAAEQFKGGVGVKAEALHQDCKAIIHAARGAAVLKDPTDGERRRDLDRLDAILLKAHGVTG